MGALDFRQSAGWFLLILVLVILMGLLNAIRWQRSYQSPKNAIWLKGYRKGTLVLIWDTRTPYPLLKGFQGYPSEVCLDSLVMSETP